MRIDMRTTLTKTLCLALLTSAAAFSQNSDIGVLLGVTIPVGTVSGNTVSGSAGASFAINYAAQIHESRAGQLYIEVPVFLNSFSSGVVGPGMVYGSIRNTVFFTPGVRYRFSPASRVSFYAMLGGGLGSFNGSRVVLSRVVEVESHSRGTTPALAFGGGLDFRLTRLLSLRFEGRDAVTKSTYDGAANHTFFLFGVGFHF
jgi:hypothetical protein